MVDTNDVPDILHEDDVRDVIDDEVAKLGGSNGVWTDWNRSPFSFYTPVDGYAAGRWWTPSEANVIPNVDTEPFLIAFEMHLELYATDTLEGIVAALPYDTESGLFLCPTQMNPTVGYPPLFTAIARVWEEPQVYNEGYLFWGGASTTAISSKADGTSWGIVSPFDWGGGGTIDISGVTQASWVQD